MLMIGTSQIMQPTNHLPDLSSDQINCNRYDTSPSSRSDTTKVDGREDDELMVCRWLSWCYADAISANLLSDSQGISEASPPSKRKVTTKEDEDCDEVDTTISFKVRPHIHSRTSKN